MDARQIIHRKVVDELGNVIEMKMWELPESSGDKPHGYKYSLVYVVGGVRVIGYDNAERKDDHRHIRGKEEPYQFESLRRLARDFYRDIEKYKRGEL